MSGQELEQAPLVVDGSTVHSSLNPEPWPGSPLHLDNGYRGALRWTPASRTEIAESLAWHCRPLWRRLLGVAPRGWKR